MQVVILCGGQGTRLREETEFRPKPMVEIGGYPILWHIMMSYIHYGYSDFILCLGYRGNLIKEYFLDYEAMNNDFTMHIGNGSKSIELHGAYQKQDFRVTLANTGLDTMTGARVKQIEHYITGDSFMLTYGDGLSDINLRSLTEFHQTHGRIATVSAVNPASRFGVLEMGGDQQVKRFIEKPKSETRTSAGFFVLNRRVFDYISLDPGCTFEREPLEQLALDDQLAAYQHDGFFYAMDTYREYLYLNDLWSSGAAPWAVWDGQKRAASGG